MRKSLTVSYRKGYKYQLAEDFSQYVAIYPEKNIETQFIRLAAGGKLTILSGYAWDGASGPTIDTKSSVRGSLVHDALYQLIRQGKLPIGCRKVADDELRHACENDGMLKIRAWFWWKKVRRWGGVFNSVRKVYTAP